MDDNGDFEIIDKKIPKMASLSSGSTSVLTSVPPPSELPSFLASPLQSYPASKYRSESAISQNTSSSESILTSEKLLTSSIPPVINQPISPSNIQSKQPQSSSIIIGPESPVGPENVSVHQRTDSWLGWFKGTVQTVSNRVAEKAKTSMDTMITTLDPQMKDFLNSGGDVDVLVASDKEIKVSPIREAFQKAFGKATVNGMDSQCTEVASQPVGVKAALKAGEGRINWLRNSGQVHPQQPIIAVEGFLIEFVPDEWYELSLLLMDDPWHDIILQMYTQVTPIPTDFVQNMKNSTSDNYPLKSSGFEKTVGQAAAESLHVHPATWQETLCGVSRRDTILLAANTLAGLYKSRLPNNVI